MIINLILKLIKNLFTFKILIVSILCIFYQKKTFSEECKIINIIYIRCYRIVKYKAFDNTILGIIFFSSLKLIIDTYYDKDP
jgi:hypothetical protein